MRSYGFITMRINGATYQARGNFNLEEGAFSREAQGNSDGSVFITEAPSPPMLEMDFERAAFAWSDAMMRASIDVTLTERSNGRQHIITDGRWVGKPKQGLSNGQVTGVQITWDAGAKQTIGG